MLDNDFAAAQFPTGTPTDNLVVTAAHEFFHAVQYAYDYAEDPWMMEATATWMEERIATQVNDNRQYFPWSQIYAPYVPLDAFSRNAGYQYGNWVFWEYLSTNYGIGIVKKAWEQAGSLKKDGGKYSITALQKVLKQQGRPRPRSTRSTPPATSRPAANYPRGRRVPVPQGPRRQAAQQGQAVQALRGQGQPPLLRVLRLRPRQGPRRARSGSSSLAVTGPVKRTSPPPWSSCTCSTASARSRWCALNRGGDGRKKVALRQPQGAARSR